MACERTEAGVLYSDDPARLDLDAAHAMLRTAYWCTDIPREVMVRSFAHSIVVGAYDGAGVLLGVARAISDRATFAYLCDVFVGEPHRGRGIGSAMVRHLMAHPDLQGLRRWSLLTRDAHGVYAKLGFTHLSDPTRYMEISRPGLYRRDGSANLPHNLQP